MSQHDDYYSRVRPLLGEGLVRHRVAVRDLSLCARTVELLRSCVLEQLVAVDPDEDARWPLDGGLFDVPELRSEGRALARLQSYLDWKNSAAPARWARSGSVHLELVGRRLPARQGAFLELDASARRLILGVPEGAMDDWLEVSNMAARWARDLLLGRRPWRDARVHLGHPLWPFVSAPRAWPRLPSAPASTRPAHLMVVGCGSVGSELLRMLDHPGRRWTLVDAARVSIYNPLRQWYGSSEIDRYKVEALATRLGRQRCRPVVDALGGDKLDRFAALLDDDRPDLVLLSTGTQDHGPLAELLWQKKIPHLAACAYPQARVFELAIVDPEAGTPCLHCFRGRLYSGPVAAPPIPSELEAFMYQQLDDEQREGMYQDLVAEPASHIETGRIAEVASRCATQLLHPAKEREPWFARLLTDQTTCLLGANAVTRLADGRFAYGLEQPGQVLRLGVRDVVESSAELCCRVCGQTIRPGHIVESAAADPDLEDQALLQLARAS